MALDALQASSLDEPRCEEPSESGICGMCGRACDSSSDKTGSGSDGDAAGAEVICDFLMRHEHRFAGVSGQTGMFEVAVVRATDVVRLALD